MPFDQVESKLATIWNSNVAKKTLTSGESTRIDIIFTTNFIKTPKVLIAFTQMDMNIKQGNFVVSVISVTQEKASIEFKCIKCNLYVLQISYLAFVDENIAVSTFDLNYALDNQHNQNFILPPKDNHKRNAMCFLMGLKTDSPKQALQLSTQIKLVVQETYSIIVLPAGMTDLQTISFNCIEYYEESNGAYKMPADFQFINLQTISLNNPSTKTFKINASFGNYQPIGFYGMTGIELGNVMLRVVITLKLQPKLSLTASTYADTKITSIDIGYFQYQMINCKKSDRINNINNPLQQNCIPRCPGGQIMESKNNINLCKSCNSSSQFILNNTCFDSQPDNTYCDANKICQPCSVPCQTCDITLKNCLSCIPKHYLQPVW